MPEKNHYDAGGISTKDVITQYSGGGQIAFYWGNVVKYLLRAGFKGQAVQDLEKAKEYLSWLIYDLPAKGTTVAAVLEAKEPALWEEEQIQLWRTVVTQMLHPLGCKKTALIALTDLLVTFHGQN